MILKICLIQIQVFNWIIDWFIDLIIPYRTLNNLDLNDIDATTYLSPFLEIIKSEETNGPITGLALSSIDKFISYGLIGIFRFFIKRVFNLFKIPFFYNKDLNSETAALCVQQIADAVTHARFVGTDSASDEVVLMKILHVCDLK